MTKILICDDDEKFCDLLSEKIKNAGKKLNTDFEIDTVNSFAKLEEEKETADILFLDVMINGKNMIDKLAEAGTQKNAEVLQTVIITLFITITSDVLIKIFKNLIISISYMQFSRYNCTAYGFLKGIRNL